MKKKNTKNKTSNTKYAIPYRSILTLWWWWWRCCGSDACWYRKRRYAPSWASALRSRIFCCTTACKRSVTWWKSGIAPSYTREWWTTFLSRPTTTLTKTFWVKRMVKKKESTQAPDNKSHSTLVETPSEIRSVHHELQIILSNSGIKYLEAKG